MLQTPSALRPPLATDVPAGDCAESFSLAFAKQPAFCYVSQAHFGCCVKPSAAAGATILVYHNPSPETFDKHMTYLASRYTFIPLGQLIDAMRNRDWSKMPARPLAVTIDDGHQGNYRLLDLIRRWNVRPTIYLCSEIVDTQRHFWWKTGCTKNHEIKKLPQEDFLNTLRNETGYEPEKKYADRQSLTLDELRAMSPYVDFGSHTQFHPILTNCAEEICREEITQSKQHLEELLGCPIADFSYPNGDYTDREKCFTSEANYRSARTMNIGWNNLGNDPLQLRAMPVDDNASINVLCGEASGLFGWIHARLHNAFESARPATLPKTEGTAKQDTIRVLMLGTEPRNGGGMGTVVQHLLDYDFAGAGCTTPLSAQRPRNERGSQITVFSYAQLSERLSADYGETWTQFTFTPVLANPSFELPSASGSPACFAYPL